MTREKIETAMSEFRAYRPTRESPYGYAVDFALEMVRRQNEELAAKWEKGHGYDKYEVAKFIREAKP